MQRDSPVDEIQVLSSPLPGMTGRSVRTCSRAPLRGISFGDQVLTSPTSGDLPQPILTCRQRPGGSLPVLASPDSDRRHMFRRVYGGDCLARARDPLLTRRSRSAGADIQDCFAGACLSAR